MPKKMHVRRRFSLSLAASLIAHALLAVIITWQSPDKPLPKPKLPEHLDVVLLDPQTKPSEVPPEKADAISNLTAKGSNTQAKDRVSRRAKSPVTGQQKQRMPTAPQLPSRPKPVPAPKPEKRTRTLARRGLTLDSTTPKKPTKRQKQKETKLPDVPLANLMPTTMALAELYRDNERERLLESMLSKEDVVSVNTREVKYATYARQLVAALEEQWRPGQANYSEYPERERRSLMSITIEGNGDLSRVEILRPSPIHQLNDTAVAAINAAAPFRPLPSVWGMDRVRFLLTFEVVEDRFVFRTL